MALGLGGFVQNTPEGVVIEVEGDAAEAFLPALRAGLPPLARLDDVRVEGVPPAGGTGFVILSSTEGVRERAIVPPDTALCADCRAEMEDPSDRRFHYPFTTCTNCGPRFSLVQALPYDRERTSMSCFPLCPECEREYTDPTDRRFHAEPVCCPACGPRMWVVRKGRGEREEGRAGKASQTDGRALVVGRGVGEDLRGSDLAASGELCGREGSAFDPRPLTAWAGDSPLSPLPSPLRGWEGTSPLSPLPSPPGGWEGVLGEVREALGRGEVVAIKGLGGFQLACRADDHAAVRRLRERKRRPSKPFAVMVRDIETARRLVRLTPVEETELSSVRAPIVLAPRRSDALVTDVVAPGLGDLGVLLPTTPLHVELFRGAPFDVLVMTSGNASDEPICRGNREALERLGGIADRFLLHDRDVVRRVDDSVVRSAADGAFTVRRARGLVPEELPLPGPSPRPVLAMGGFLQNAACLTVGPAAFCSQHVGDLDSEPARAFLGEVVEELEGFLQVTGQVIVVDAHPDYPSTWLGEELARRRDGELLRVQHHLAHAAAVLGEHGRFPEQGRHALAIALDGTGWGPDGTAWGGEWLRLGGDLGWRRLASLQPLPLVGGEAAVREPWRVLAAALALEGAVDLMARLPVAQDVDRGRLEAVTALAGHRWPLASGAGRVFEALGVLLGVASVNGYEGEAAARAEALAAATWPAAAWPEVTLAEGGPPPPRPWSKVEGPPSRPPGRESRVESVPRTPPDTPTHTAPTRLGGVWLPSGALLRAAAERLLAGETAMSVAAGFHATFCALVVELTRGLAPGGVVALGGGCLVNRLLRQGLADGLQAAGFEPLLPRRVPPGDGGLAYGQAVLGVASALRRVVPQQEGVD
jgi:hydrogenase maturation protein HypF